MDWIEAQLKSYGCPTERIKLPATHAAAGAPRRAAAAAAATPALRAGRRPAARQPDAAPASIPIR